MIRREYGPDLINRISNLPGVREAVCYHDREMDWSSAFPAHKTQIIVLSNGVDACALLGETTPRRWQEHTFFAPTCRGKAALAVGREIVEWMRPHADVICGATPMSNRAARWFNRQLGAVVVGHDTYEMDGDVELFELRLH